MITQIAAKFGDLVSAAPAAAGELQKDEMEMSVSLQPGSDFPRSFFWICSPLLAPNPVLLFFR